VRIWLLEIKRLINSLYFNYSKIYNVFKLVNLLEIEMNVAKQIAEQIKAFPENDNKRVRITIYGMITVPTKKEGILDVFEAATGLDTGFISHTGKPTNFLKSLVQEYSEMTRYTVEEVDRFNRYDR
jgi:hypothetical protein